MTIFLTRRLEIRTGELITSVSATEERNYRNPRTEVWEVDTVLDAR